MSAITGREKIKEYIKKYGSSGVDYFTLKNDGDRAEVRFLHTDDQDLELHLVHKVEVDGKERYVECLEDNCPLCELGKPSLKLFLFLFDKADDKIKVWERGQGMIDFLFGYIDKYGALNNRDYEIVRHGKKNDTKTQYQLFNSDKGPLVDSSNKEIEIPERPNIYDKKIILKYTAEQMKALISGSAPVSRQRGKGDEDIPF